MEKIEYINVVPTISVQSDGVGKFVRNLHLAISNSLVESSICSQKYLLIVFSKPNDLVEKRRLRFFEYIKKITFLPSKKCLFAL